METLPVGSGIGNILTVAIPENFSQFSALVTTLKAQKEMAELAGLQPINLSDRDGTTWETIAQYLDLALDAVTEAEHFTRKAADVIARERG